ncbi:MAG: response regulator [Desulfobacteraceae bacterium]|nr:response regulator [Desulfobacteraceae bacterium]
MINVLVIDDEQMILGMLEHVLSKVNFNVETADNALGGIEKFEKGSFDLVITDILMPGNDGYSVVHHIRKSVRQSTPVIGVSGTPHLLHESEFDEILFKPFAIRKLIQKARVLTSSDTIH